MPQLFGWVDRPRDVEAALATMPRPLFAQAGRPIADSGKGKVVLLHEALNSVLGTFPVHDQKIGDCVSHGWGLCVDILKAVEILLLKEPEAFIAETATEQIYHTSRVDIGRGQLGNEDGSLGAWAAKAVTQYGIALRKKYGSVDLTNYSGSLAKQWGNRGAKLPADVDAEALEHSVRTTSLVTTYEEARDAIANGYPVAVCSMVGFQERRDNEGFAKASGQWAHCMAFIAVDDAHSRPGLLCMNSWGPGWISGPKRHNQPDGSFWVDADTANRMLKDRDSFALSSFAGYPGRTLPENWMF